MIWLILTSVLLTDITPIADIQSDPSAYNNVTVQGVVTIGAGVIDDQRTKAYIQDDSGAGINIFDYDIANWDLLKRGNLVEITGEIEEYQGITEIMNYTITLLDSNIALPEPRVLTLDEALNNVSYEGTWMQVQGTVYELYEAGGGTNVNLDDGLTRFTVRVWSTTGIDLSEIVAGLEIVVNGVASVYNNLGQLLLAYQEDFTLNEPEPVPEDVQLSFSPEVIQIGGGREISIDFTVTGQDKYRLSVYHPNGEVIVVLRDGTGPVNSTISWDGRDRLGKPLKVGAYLIILELPAKGEKEVKGVAVAGRP
jgi:hypothetical protein